MILSCSFTHEKLAVLIDFITVMPSETASHDRGHKYPFLASEIFACELPQILEKFFELPESQSVLTSDTSKQEQMLTRVDTDEDCDSPLNSVQPTEAQQQQ